MQNPTDPIQIHVFPPDHVYFHRTSWWDLLSERRSFDGVVHTVALANLSSELLVVNQMEVEAYLKDRLVVRQVLTADELQMLAAPIEERITSGLGRTLDLIIFMDRALPSGIKPSSSSAINPRSAIIVPNIYLECHILPDTLRLKVVVADAQGEKITVATSLKALEFTCRNEYCLPVEGTWFMKAYPETGRMDHHRFGVSNEFGVDFLKLGPEGELFQNEGQMASDWYSHGEKVIAAASGKVVATHDSSVQEWTRFNPGEGETDEEFQKRQLREVHEALAADVLDWAAGNYIVIEHSEGEFSSYLHLKEASVRVKVGDDVAMGYHIADVGNTGDSYGAHLHFQITDSKDLITGRSLPFAFSGMIVDLEEPGRFVRSAA